MKNLYYKKFLKTQKTFLYNTYKHYRNTLTHLSIYFQDNLQNCNKMWSKINEFLQNKKRLDETLYICGNGITISDTTKIANKFNNYFTNVAQEVVKKLRKTNNKFQDYLKNPNEHSVFLKEAEPGGVLKILNSLNTKKSSDIFGISPKLIKIAAGNLKTQISVIFNYSIHQVVFPSKLKIGLIRPIYKNKSKTMCSNYRPISILPLPI